MHAPPPKSSPESEMKPLQPLRKTKAAADFVGIPDFTFKKLRYLGRGPKYLRISGRIFYRESDLREFVESCVVDPAKHAAARNRARRRVDVNLAKKRTRPAA
jgi:hypothetical protein